MDMWKGEIKLKDCRLCWMHSSLLASVDVTEFQATEMYSSLDLTGVKYYRFRYFKGKKKKIMLQTRPNNFIHCENI
jgi:hypothetical protein